MLYLIILYIASIIEQPNLNVEEMIAEFGILIWLVWKNGVMEKINFGTFTATEVATLDVLREQDSCISFKENPSDKYDQAVGNKIIDRNSCRIKGQDLFLLFTADIIKQRVPFVR